MPFYQPSVDREWYAEDASTTMALSGSDLNPISSFRDRTKKRVTAWQAQLNRDTDRWEQSETSTMSNSAQHATLFNPLLDDDHNISQTQLTSLDAAAPFMALGTKYGEMTASIPGVYINKKHTGTLRSTAHPPLSVFCIRKTLPLIWLFCVDKAAPFLGNFGNGASKPSTCAPCPKQLARMKLPAPSQKQSIRHLKERTNGYPTRKYANNAPPCLPLLYAMIC